MLKWEYYPAYLGIRAHYMAVVGDWYLIARKNKNGWAAIVDFREKRMAVSIHATAAEAQAAAILAVEKICKPIAPIIADLDGTRSIKDWLEYPSEADVPALCGLVDTREGMKLVRARGIQEASSDGAVAAAQGAGASGSAGVPALHEVAGR